MKRIRTKQLLIVFLLFLAGTVSAQIQVTGIVRDGITNETLPGANVYIEGTTRGVISDMNGSFAINVPRPNTVLIISFIGYTQQRIPLDGQIRLEVNLFPDMTALQEVVVIGYGTVDARKVAGSISSVSSEDINKINVGNLDLALQGRAAGLQVSATSGEPNSMVRIRIRGNTSISGDNEPLIVVDGFPMFSAPRLSGDLGEQDASPLSFINMDDVASVEILKDASATAIYGSRGANGVILVTTKQGAAGRARIDFSVETFLNSMPNFPEMMSGPQWIAFRNEINYWGDGKQLNTDTLTTRWLDRILQRAMGQNYNMSFSGGTRDSRYLISAAYSDTDGALIGSTFKRGTIRANLNNNLTEKMTLSSNMSFSQTFTDYSGGGPYGNVIWSAMRSVPTRPVADQTEEEDPITQDYFPSPTNPIFNITEQRDKTDQKIFLANLTFDYRLFNDLKLTFRGGGNYNIQNRERYWGRRTGFGYSRNGSGTAINTMSSNYLAEFFGTYTKIVSNHNIGLVLGTSYQTSILKGQTVSVNNFPSDGMSIYGLGGGIDVVSFPYTRTDRVIHSYFFRANYDYASKYILSLSGRVDGSSVFTEDQKYAFFPAVAVAWRVNEEPFMKNLDFVSEFKVRVGFGRTGNQAIRPYESIPQFTFNNYLAGNNEVFGVRPLIIGNPELKWETTEQINAGIDLSIMMGRLGLSFDYYQKTTHDLLLPFQLPLHMAFSAITMNRGSLENKGIEITLSGEPVRTADFSWNTNLNYTRNRNLILDLGDLDYIPGPPLAGTHASEPLTGQWVGKPFSVYYGYQISGLVQRYDFDVNGNRLVPIFETPNVGAMKWVDQNHDFAITSDDRTFLGDPNPNFIFGFNNDFSYKRFSLNMFWQGSVGGLTYNASRAMIYGLYELQNQSAEWYEKRWRTDVNEHNNPRYPVRVSQAHVRPSDLNVEDGTYVRLRNLSLRYAIPIKSSSIRTLDVYITGTNLLTITNYSGFDPEVSYFRNRDDAIGVDFFSYPLTRTFTFGMKLGL